MTVEELAEENGLLKKTDKPFLFQISGCRKRRTFGLPKNDNADDNSGTRRNGYTTKTVITYDNYTIESLDPRDRNSTFESVIIP